MGKDPYRYFRVEARELLEGLTQGILQLEKGPVTPDQVARLLRLGHTLKGASRVVKQPGIAELAHATEGILASHRDSGQPLSREQGTELLRLCDEIASQLRTLDPTSESEAGKSSRPTAEESFDTLRVEMREMDLLLRGTTEAAVQLGAIRRDLDAIGRLRGVAGLLLAQLGTPRIGNGGGPSPALVRAQSLAEELRTSLDRLQRDLSVQVERVDGELAEVGDLAYRLRLVPAHAIFPSLDRATRDAAEAVGKRVELEVSGGEVRLDATVLAALRDALLHVVRNAVAHGVENESERAAVGKSPAGHVRVEVERRGNRVAFVCRDDGRGIDLEAVRAAAVARGLVSASQASALSADQVIGLLLRGGLTTARDVTELSGRGIGLDVARETAARLKGDLSIRSEVGRGTMVEIRAPVSIAALHGLVVEAAGTLATIPLEAIRQTLRIAETDVARSAESNSILHEGKVIPFLALDRALGRSTSVSRARRAWSAVVVQTGDRSVAVGVDRLLGTSSIVMRSLPAAVAAHPIVAGASLDAEGNPQLVLDPIELVALAERGHGSALGGTPPGPAPILVIDDSLTTRMLEKSILESAGYEVEMAVSAEDALAKACDGRYSLFLVDVEMPGMDGFEFLEATRADPTLRSIPAILVTSRNAPEDRRRGEQAGARAYIVKGEFDQGKLLQTIRELIG
ncbi:MAG: hybrid sensor histidine kinase/response regulator [Gemmatimonadales bacterium]